MDREGKTDNKGAFLSFSRGRRTTQRDFGEDDGAQRSEHCGPGDHNYLMSTVANSRCNEWDPLCYETELKATNATNEIMR